MLIMMTSLNLVSLSKSDIKYRVDVFPDGEPSLVVESELNHKEIEKVRITTRLSSMNDVFVLLQAIDILNRHGLDFNVYITYLMSMRMDRVMDWNRPYSLSIMANILKNAIGDHEIYVFEPHSKKTLDLLGAKEYTNEHTYMRQNLMSHVRENLAFDANTIVYPDDGARARYKTCNDSVCFKKKRDLATGNIIGLEFADKEDIDTIKIANNIVVIDDLCDGGRTFVGVAEKIREYNKHAKLTIIVAHAVNPVGIKNMSENYDRVIISNSYSDWKDVPENVEVVEIV